MMSSVPSSDAVLAQWNKALQDASDLTDRLGFLLRLANYTNQRVVARTLAQVLQVSATPFDITIFGKPEAGAERIADDLYTSLEKVRSTILEAADYRDVNPQALVRARNSVAIVFIVSALAPFFDETVEFIAREFALNKENLFLAVVDDEDDRAVKELIEAATQYAALHGVTLRSAAELAGALAEMLPMSRMLEDLRAQVRSCCERLIPVVDSFTELLSIGQVQYLRRVDFIHRDVGALSALAGQAQELLESQSKTALSNVTAVLQVLCQNMRLQAETAVQNAPVPKDALGNQDARTGWDEVSRAPRGRPAIVNSTPTCNRSRWT